VLAVFRFIKQNPNMTHAQVQPTLIAALGLELVRDAWLEARREVEGPAEAEGAMQQGAPQQLPPQPLPPQQPHQQQQQLPRQHSLPAPLRRPRLEEEEQGGAEGEEGRRVRQRLARQDTVMWRAGDAMPLHHSQQHPNPPQVAAASRGCPHQPPEPRPDEHHPRCPFYAPPPPAEQQQQQQHHHHHHHHGHHGQGQTDVAVEEEEAEHEEYAEDDDDDDDDDDLVSVASTATAALAAAAPYHPAASARVPPVVLLLAKEEPELEDEDSLQEDAPDGFTWCVI
jgi:hypothetical protein